MNDVEADNLLEEGRSDESGGVKVTEKLKCAYMERRSTTIKITEFPLVFRNPSMKSMAMSCHTAAGMSSG
jgi:hypothetical protein